MADWHWEPVTDDLLGGLPSAAPAAAGQVAEELTVRESMICSTGGSSQACRQGRAPPSEAQLILVYLTDARGERVVIIQVNWIS